MSIPRMSATSWVVFFEFATSFTIALLTELLRAEVNS